MNISAVSAQSAQAILTANRGEAAEGPGPDHDGDADDLAVSASAPVKAAVGPGVGQKLDMTI